MVFTGYCENSDLVKYLDFGGWFTLSIAAYDPATDYYIPLTSFADGTSGYLINDMISGTEDGTTIVTTTYSVNLTTGLITFSTDPTTASAVVFTYYLNREISNTDISVYVLEAARMFEYNARRTFRSYSSSYNLDATTGLTYDTYESSDYAFWLALPYDIQSITSIVVNDTTVTPATVKINGNKFSLTEDSEVDYISGDLNSVVITVLHGITETVLDRTEEELREISMVLEANRCLAAMLIIESPKGRNITLDNSYVVQKSDGSVRPDITTNEIYIKIKQRYDDLMTSLKGSSSSII